VSDRPIDISENPTPRASLLVCLSSGVARRGNFAAYQDNLRRSMIRTEMLPLSPNLCSIEARPGQSEPLEVSKLGEVDASASLLKTSGKRFAVFLAGTKWQL
jgi:hypothetical protein